MRHSTVGHVVGQHCLMGQPSAVLGKLVTACPAAHAVGMGGQVAHCDTGQPSVPGTVTTV
jgi:hypothetical protein